MHWGSVSFAFVVLHIFCVSNQELVSLLHYSESVGQRPSRFEDPPIIWKEYWKDKTFTQSLWLVHFNHIDHVAIYFDENCIRSITKQNTNAVDDGWFVRNPHWVFNFVPKVWRYMTDTYGQFGTDIYLKLVIRGENLPTASHGTHYEYSLDPGNTRRKNILDVSLPSFEVEESDLTRNKNMDLLAIKLANFVENSSKQRVGSPSLSIWKSLSIKAPSAWVDIFTYDVYTNLNLTDHAQRYNHTVIHKNRRVSSYISTQKNWFQNWFYPIYSNYGGNIALNKYFELLSTNLPHVNEMYDYELTRAEFVHFWSGAANSDLTDLAKTAFGWDPTFAGLANARKMFPLNYTKAGRREQMVYIPIETVKMEVEVVEVAHVIIGAIIIAVGVLALVVKLCILRIRNINLQAEIPGLTEDDVKWFFEGELKVNQEDENQASVLSMPFLKHFEISRDRLIPCPNKVIGSGQFGLVMHGFIRNQGNNGRIPVALKTVKADVEVIHFKAMLSEAKILAYLGRHDHIVRLLGTCTANIKSRKIFLALELCPLGDLHKFLQKNRHNYKNMISAELANTTLTVDFQVADEYSALNQISTLDLLKWAQEISNAMVYLTEKKVIHGDLAARNVLLTKNRIVQISDFGLSRQLLNYANYQKTSDGPLPWRWMAIEALNDMKFSVASDIWSYGVTLWEMFSLAAMPYAGWVYNYSFLDRLMRGERLESPQFANDDIFELMKNCWKLKPRKRPSFDEIHYILGIMISQLSKDEVENTEGDL